jgi:hypothetical protein
MPLGISQYILCNNENLSFGYWEQTSVRGGGEQRSLRFTESSSSIGNTSNATVSLWFRGTTSEYDEKFILYGAETNPISDNNFIIDIRREGGEPAGIFAAFHLDGYGGDRIMAAPANFEDLYLNNQWHHLFVQFRGQGDNFYEHSRIYIDGVDKTTAFRGQEYPGNPTIGTLHSFSGYLGAYSGNVDTENTIDIAEIWVKYGDSDNYIPNIDWFYNNGKAVNLGNDGTASGAPAPHLYLHEDGSNYDSSGEHLIQDGISSLDGYIVNGGTLTGTLSHVGDATGQITAYDTGGPLIAS